MTERVAEHVSVAVIGAGFGGIGTAVQLLKRGIRDIVVLERADDVGGTWRDNVYPGAACDIRSDLYSFSFAPNPDWKHLYGRQPELLAYLRATADRFGIRSLIRFNTRVTAAAWDDSERVWRIRTGESELTADAIVSGHGLLVQPRWPEISGLRDFTGTLLHSARWDSSVDLTGKRVAVIGTGASAIQIVPELAAVSSSLTVFQRTAPWISPRGDRPTTERRRRWFRRAPLLQRLVRGALFTTYDLRILGFRFAAIGRVAGGGYLRRMRAQVADPILREKLTPDYRLGCKRILVSDDFYPAIVRANVELVSDRISEVSGGRVIAGGLEHEVDVLVCATGYDAVHPPIAELITGRDGRTLAETWAGSGMEAMHGTTVAGFPNLFLLAGPNTALGHNSMVYVIERQLAYAVRMIETMRRRRLRSIEPRADAQLEENRMLQRGIARSAWAPGGCSSWYVDPNGRNTAVWPFSAGRFGRSVRRLDLERYEVVR